MNREKIWPETSVDWFRHPTMASQLVLCSVSSVVGLVGYRTWQQQLKRLKTAAHIPPEWIQMQRTLKGRVISVGDSDNFRVLHCPDWLPVWITRWVKLSGRQLTKNTIHVRLAGIDAPEGSAFGMPKQKFSDEAKTWLTKTVLNKPVYFKLHRRDQYQRLVCTVWRPYYWVFKRNVSLEMVQSGWAVVYESAGAEYDGLLLPLKAAEGKAQKKKLGIWNQANFVHPAEHKKTHLR